MWLRCRPPALVPIRHLAWELPYASATALKKKKKKSADVLKIYFVFKINSEIGFERKDVTGFSFSEGWGVVRASSSLAFSYLGLQVPASLLLL